jgi:hypothetical protein
MSMLGKKKKKTAVQRSASSGLISTLSMDMYDRLK